MSKKVLKGKVTSNKMTNAVVVAVDTTKPHPIYSKMVISTKKYKAVDPLNAKIGDVVYIEECAPVSKEIAWKVISIIEE